MPPPSAQRDLAEARAELEALRAEIRQARRLRRNEPERDRRLGAATQRAARVERAIRELDQAAAVDRSARAVTRSRPDLGVHGTILAIEGDDAEVVGASGQRIRIPLARLRPSRQREPEAEQPVKVVAMASGDVSDELDVRGQRAQEAREAVRSFVDDAALAGLFPASVSFTAVGPARYGRPCEKSSTGTVVDRRESDSADGATVAHLQ